MKINELFVANLLITTIILIGTILTSTFVFGDDVVDEVNVIVPESCTMSGTGMNTHNAEIQNGTYQANIGTTTLHAFCNDNNGFAIYAAGYTGNEIGATNSNKLVGTSASSNATIVTGLVTSTPNPDISNWAMKLAITQDSGDTTGTNAFTIDSDTEGTFSAYHTVPNEYTKVAHKNSATDMTTNTGGIKLTTTYAAYISKTQPADTYTGQVIYTLVHPASMAAPIVSKSLNTATTMQEVEYCSANIPVGQVYTLTDSRDGNVYHVARLADGNCWMLDNLALDPTDSTTAANMNETNTNATAAAITNLLNGGSTEAGWSSVAVIDCDSGYSSTEPMINNAYKDMLVTSYGLASINGQAKVGIYYNYCAASAGTFCYGDGQIVDVSDTLLDADQDLCPANWRMPTRGMGGEYDGLFSAYNTTQDATNANSLQYNLSTPLSGQFQNEGAFGHNYYGAWWSSTYNNIIGGGYYMSYMDVTSETVFEDYDYGPYDGLSMRCLVKN